MEWTDKRALIVTRLKETQLELRPPRRAQHDIQELRELRHNFNRLLAEYVENLPFQVVSRCPFCSAPLEIAIDTVGLDAPWWWDQCPEEFAEPRGCEHFQVFLGALDLHGREPHEVDVWGVLPGPGAPFVIDRMMSMDGMQAVVSTVPVGVADTGYLIAYFSFEPVHETDLHQEWRRQTWVLHDDSGKGVARELVNDPWDFELAPWLERGKLLWIEPGDASLTLRKGTPCPYENLPGTRMKQIMGSGELKLGATPDGSKSEYYGAY